MVWFIIWSPAIASLASFRIDPKAGLSSKGNSLIEKESLNYDSGLCINGTMMRQWEWIRRYCEKRGMRELAETADQIDRVLYYLYGNVEVAGWTWFMRYCNEHSVGVDTIETLGFDQEAVAEVIVGDSYDRCAYENEHESLNGNGCDKCRFGALVGRCSRDQDSLFSEFCAMFKEGLKR